MFNHTETLQTEEQTLKKKMFEVLREGRHPLLRFRFTLFLCRFNYNCYK